MKRLLSGDHLVEHTAKAPDIGPSVDFKSARLFGRHVLRCAQHHADFGFEEVLSGRHGIGLGRSLALRSQFGQTEIEDFNDAVMTQHDVVWLDVAMDDPDGVSGAKCAGDLDADVERVARFEGAHSDSVAQRVTVDEFGGDEMFGIDLVDLVDRQNVWMVERGSGLCFLHKPAYAIGRATRLRFNHVGGSIFSATLRSSLVSLAR